MKTTYSIIILLSISLLGCENDEITSISPLLEAISVTTNQATLIDDGSLKSSSYQEIGFLYSTNPDVSESNGIKVLSECYDCPAQYAIADGLSENTTYYFKEYGKNGDTYTLSEAYEFTTYSSGTWVPRVGNESFSEGTDDILRFHFNSYAMSDGHLYSFGGTDGADTYSKVIWKYTPILDKWSKVTSSPEELWSDPGTMTIGNNIYVITAPYQESHKIFSYNATSDSWIQKNNFPELEFNGIEFESFHFENIYYALVSDINEEKIYSYDVNSDAWELYYDAGFGTIGSLHKPKAVVLGDKVYIQPASLNSRNFIELDITNKILLQNNDLPDLGFLTQIISEYDGKILLASQEGTVALFDPVSFEHVIIGSSGENVSLEDVHIIDDRIFFIDHGSVIDEFLM